MAGGVTSFLFGATKMVVGAWKYAGQTEKSCVPFLNGCYTCECTKPSNATDGLTFRSVSTCSGMLEVTLWYMSCINRT